MLVLCIIELFRIRIKISKEGVRIRIKISKEGVRIRIKISKGGSGSGVRHPSLISTVAILYP